MLMFVFPGVMLFILTFMAVWIGLAEHYHND